MAAKKQFQLNLYELHRQPLTIKQRSDANNKISIKSSILESLLTCPICLDVLDQAMVTKACLHRFCKDCITTALRQSNQECPTCRKKMVSRRDLREDPNFDSLINKLFPKRKEIYEKEQEELRKLVASHATSLTNTAAAHGVLAEDMESNPKQKTKKSRKRKTCDSAEQEDPVGNLAKNIEKEGEHLENVATSEADATRETSGNAGSAS